MTETEAARLAEAHRRLLADHAIQFDLPAYIQPEPPAWAVSFARFLRWLSPAFPYLFWGAVAIGGGIILLLITRELVGARWQFPWLRKKAEADEEEWRPEESVARALLEDAERLAREGRYAEATHLLLQRSVEDITRRHPALVRPSVTARDLAAAPTLPERARNAFAAIARVVETSLFGGRPVDATGWESCRNAYADFALAASWR
jgi:hypothetical protein